MSYVPRPLSEISQTEPGKLDCDAHSLGASNGLARDHYLIGELQAGLAVECSSAFDSLGDRIGGPSQGQLFILTGGLGQAEAGAVASRVALESIARYFAEHPLRGDHSRQEAMADAFAASQQRLRQRRAARNERDAAATSVTMALVEWPEVNIAHVGDTRCYLYHRTKLQSLTSVHTLGARCSQQNESDWPAPSWRDVLWNAITGAERNAEPEFVQRQLALGDALILVTAPLAKAVSESRILNLLREDLAATETCRRILKAAQTAGCRDEGAVMIVRFRSPQRWEQLQASQSANPDERRSPPGNSRPASRF